MIPRLGFAFALAAFLATQAFAAPLAYVPNAGNACA